MEASALPASVGLGRTRTAIGAPLLRIRSDEQLVTLFREGNEDAFRVIHDRYRPRLLIYTRQMLGATSQDPEGALQEIFVRAYYGLRASGRDLALRAWLYRIAHNRCVDDLRRQAPIAVQEVEALAAENQDPAIKVEQRDALRRLIIDVQRLPDQQRSALLMRELSGMAYADVSGALAVSVPAVKSLLVRARLSLAQASEARNTACAEIREDVIFAHDRGVRTSGLARRHMHDCESCREFRGEVRGVSRQLAALAPTIGPLGAIAHLLGWGGGGSAMAGGGTAGGGAAAASGGAAVATGAAGTGVVALASGHMVTLLAAVVVTAGGAAELQKTLSTPAPRHAHHQAAATGPSAAAAFGDLDTVMPTAAASSAASSAPPAQSSSGGAPRSGASSSSSSRADTAAARSTVTRSSGPPPISETLDPDHLGYPTGASGTGSSSGATGPTSSGTGTGSGAGTTGSSTGSGAGTGTSTATGASSGTVSTTGTASGSGTNTDTGSGTGTSSPSSGSSTGNSSSTGASGSTSGSSTSVKVVSFGNAHPRRG